MNSKPRGLIIEEVKVRQGVWIQDTPVDSNAVFDELYARMETVLQQTLLLADTAENVFWPYAPAS